MSKWQRKEYKNPEGGLNAKGVAQYKKENPGSDLKMGVDKTPQTPEEIRRQGQFLTRFYGRSDIPPLKKPNGEPTRFALAASAWNSKVPQNMGDVQALAKKGRELLDKYKALGMKKKN